MSVMVLIGAALATWGTAALVAGTILDRKDAHR